MSDSALAPDKPYKFIVVSAVKKLVHDKDRRCAPEFLEALDCAVSALVRKACEAHNGGAKTLDASVLSNGTTARVPTAAGIKVVYDEVHTMGLQMRVQTQEEFQKRIRSIKQGLEPFLSAK